VSRQIVLFVCPYQSESGYSLAAPTLNLRQLFRRVQSLYGEGVRNKGIHLTNLVLMDHKIKDPKDICRQSRTSDRELTAIHNGSLQLT